jgi:two-component system, LytTR family, sensor kinase
MKKSMITLLHISYWVLYLFVVFIYIMALNIHNANFTNQNRNVGFFLHPIVFGAIIPALIGFYTFYYVLFFKFLSNKKIINLVFASILVAFLAAVLTELLMFIFLPKHGINWEWNTIIFMGLFLAFIALAHGITGLMMHGFITWYKDIKLKSDLNKKNYDMEIALVKSQLNPHFLFNTISNIDTLILKDPAVASSYLNKLSDIMRFMLYEAKTEFIPLSKEITYIEKFIALQKIRTSNPNYVNFTVIGNPQSHQVPPMLLIAFIENAFKHVENKKIENAITIKIEIEKNKIEFHCENYFDKNALQLDENHGIGSELIKKRLQLLYPQKHQLSVMEENHIYKVKLILSL